jgi:subtilase family serine protease
MKDTMLPRLFNLIIAAGLLLASSLACTLGPSIAPTATITNLPDLVITSVVYAPSLIDPCKSVPGNQDAGIAVTVTNRGTVNVGVFGVDVSAGEAHVGALVDSPGLAAGQSVTLRFTALGPQVTAVVDSANTVKESDETNNTMTASVPVPTPIPPCMPT